MPVYTYRAKKGPKDIVDGNINADNEREAVEKLSQMGYLPIRVEEQAKAGKQQDRPLVRRRRMKVKSREITIFSRQLASLLKSGVPILHAINIISEQSENAVLKTILSEVHNAVEDGTILSAVLKQYPEAFSHLYVAMIRSGEDSGTLPEALLRIADYRAKHGPIGL